MRGQHKDAYLASTYNKAKEELSRWEHLHDAPKGDKVWIPPLRTGSGCRFGYWKETKNNDESDREALSNIQ